MDTNLKQWIEVDAFFTNQLVNEDANLEYVKQNSILNDLPSMEVSPLQGKLLSIFVRMIQSKRVLEIGTLAGYSTLWMAESIDPDGKVVTLEVSKEYSKIARQNFKFAGLEDVIEVLDGPAIESLEKLNALNIEPFDLIFIDADKKNNPIYFELALKLIRDGGIIIADNVVRNGAVCDPLNDDLSAQGVRDFVCAMGRNSKVTATAIQTVGSKGWDGFSIAIVSK